MSPGAKRRWVWHVWWDEVQVCRGESRWQCVAMLRLWREHRRAVRFVHSGCGEWLLVRGRDS